METPFPRLPPPLQTVLSVGLTPSPRLALGRFRTSFGTVWFCPLHGLCRSGYRRAGILSSLFRTVGLRFSFFPSQDFDLAFTCLRALCPKSVLCSDGRQNLKGFTIFVLFRGQTLLRYLGLGTPCSFESHFWSDFKDRFATGAPSSAHLRVCLFQ